jgi:hypothetical protein
MTPCPAQKYYNTGQIWALLRPERETPGPKGEAMVEVMEVRWKEGSDAVEVTSRLKIVFDSAELVQTLRNMRLDFHRVSSLQRGGLARGTSGSLFCSFPTWLVAWW